MVADFAPTSQGTAWSPHQDCLRIALAPLVTVVVLDSSSAINRLESSGSLPIRPAFHGYSFSPKLAVQDQNFNWPGG